VTHASLIPVELSRRNALTSTNAWIISSVISSEVGRDCNLWRSTLQHNGSARQLRTAGVLADHRPLIVR
jgi:hypothetical protein